MQPFDARSETPAARKLDALLRFEWRRFRARNRTGARATGDHPVTVVVELDGEADELEALGFQRRPSFDGSVIGEIQLSALEDLISSERVKRVEVAPRIEPHLHVSVPFIEADKVWTHSPFGYTGRGVLVGIVDAGIDISHGSFRHLKTGKTRLLGLWDQSLPPAPPHNRQKYGSEYNRDELDALLKIQPLPRPLPGIETSVLEASIFRAKEVPHGSHVAGIAAGNGGQPDRCHDAGYYVGVAKEADLVVVKYRSDNSFTPVTDAVEYIIKFAENPLNFDERKPRPVVINLSLGLTMFKHDTQKGRNFTQKLEELMAGKPGITLVASSGNETAALFHRHRELAANGSTSLKLRTQFILKKGAASTEQLLIICDGAAELTLTLSSEDIGQSLGPLPPRATAYNDKLGDHPIMVSSPNGPNNAGQREIVIDVSPSKSTSEIAGGIWTIDLKAGNSKTGVDVWTSGGFELSAVSSFFTFADPPSEIDRNNTLGFPAESQEIITVGNYDSLRGMVNETSSRGPLGWKFGDEKPDLVAPGTGIIAPQGGFRYGCSSCCTDAHAPDTGTSMAAPHVTGVVALMLQADPTLSRTMIKKILRGTATKPPSGIPDNTYGWGILNARKAIEAILPFPPPLVPDPLAPVPPPPGPGPHALPAFPIEAPLLAARPRFWVNAPLLAERLRELTSLGSRTVELIVFLVSTHVDEVLRLIDDNRRVGAVWRGRGGHQLVRYLLRKDQLFQDALVPANIEGHDTRELFAGMVAMFDRYGGEALRSDVARYGSVFVDVPGRPLGELDTIEVRGMP